MPMLEIKIYIYQLFRSLAYIHSQGICHRDIKPQNLLLDPNTGVLKLCDFGSAKILVENEPNVSYICSRYYRAPELIFGATNYTTKIGKSYPSFMNLVLTNSLDVWSTGCVMAELMLGQPLFPGESGIDQLVEIIKVLGTPTREQIRTMNPNYMEHKFPQIKPHPFQKVASPPTLRLQISKGRLTVCRSSARHQVTLSSSLRPSLSTLPLNVSPQSMQCVIHFLMNFVTLSAASRILVIPMQAPRRCRSCSISPVTVSLA